MEDTNEKIIPEKKQGLKGFDINKYTSAKNTQPQQYDTSKLAETLTEMETDKAAETAAENGTITKVQEAQAKMMLWLIDKMVSSILGIVSLTFDSKKYAASKADRDELVEYAGPVAEKILEKFEPYILLILGLSAIYGDKIGQAISDRRTNIDKKKEKQPTPDAKQAA